MKTQIKVLLIIIVISLFSCDKDKNDENFTNCDKQVVISANEYSTLPNDQLTINTLEINENCLKINFSASGCSGNAWELKLVDAEEILESDPPQRNLRLSLKNEELCEAYITKELTFEIRALQVNGNRVLLNITNSNDQILYAY